MQPFGMIFMGAMVGVLVGVPLCLRLAAAMKIFDRPGTRKVHSTAMPRTGGLAVVGASLGVIAMALLAGTPQSAEMTQVLALLAGCLLVCGVGLIDDVWRLRARAKLVGQIAAALVLCWFDVRINGLAIAGLFEWNLGWLSWPVTVLWVVGITNAVNMIDGLDGLAAGVSAIACAVLATAAFGAGQVILAMMLVAVLGSLVGFLFFNFSPARIFLGDCGSMFVGFFLAGTGVMSASRANSLAAVAMCVLALGVPLLDMLFSMIRRALDRRSLLAPDRGHIHHRLIDFGFGHRQAVLMIYAVSAGGGAVALVMLVVSGVVRFGVFVVGLSLLVFFFRHYGAIRFRQAFHDLRRNRAMANVSALRRRKFEEMQLRIREAETVEQWWRVVRRAARHLDLARVAIVFHSPVHLSEQLSWHAPNADKLRDIVKVSMRVHDSSAGKPIEATIEMEISGSLEAAGGGLMLFGRLMAERSFGDLVGGAPRPVTDPGPSLPLGQWVSDKRRDRPVVMPGPDGQARGK